LLFSLFLVHIGSDIDLNNLVHYSFISVVDNMKIINHLKSIGLASKTALVTSVLAAMAAVAGCSEANLTREYKFKDYPSRVLETTSLSLGMESTKMDISIPEAYGNIPPHPDDLNVNYGPNHPCKTRKVDLKSGTYWSNALGISASPLPYNFIENLRLGYTAVLPLDTANQIREGLSSMEWYEYGAYAGTYSRVEVPEVIHSFRASWRQPIPLGGIGFFVEPGVALDLWDVHIQGGWDRYYREQPMFNDKLSCQSISPFVHVGLYAFNAINDKYPAAISFYWKRESIDGSTNKGDVELEGTTLGLEAMIGF